MLFNKKDNGFLDSAQKGQCDGVYDVKNNYFLKKKMFIGACDVIGHVIRYPDLVKYKYDHLHFSPNTPLPSI